MAKPRAADPFPIISPWVYARAGSWVSPESFASSCRAAAVRKMRKELPEIVDFNAGQGFTPDLETS